MQDVRKPSHLKRIAVIGRTVGLLVAVGALALLGGCGGKDESESTAQANKRSLQPAVRDTAAVDSLAGRLDSGPPPGTSVAPRVSSSLAKDKPTLRAAATAAGGGAKPEVNSPDHQPQVSSGDGAFSLQLGSFRNANYARVQAERINGMGYFPVIEVASLAGQTYHRVVLQGLPDRDEAERLGELIRSQLGITYLIRRK